MLALTRKPGESIHLEGVGTVTVVSVKGDQVKLSFDVYRNITIDRAEVRERKLTEARDQEGREGWL